MKYILGAMIAALTVAAFAACGATTTGDEGPRENPDGFDVYVIKVGNQKFNCVRYSGYKQGGVSCDFSRPVVG